MLMVLIFAALAQLGNEQGHPVNGRTYLSVDPSPDTPSKPGAPTLTGITARYGVTMRSGQKVDIQPEFHFIAPGGDVVRLHRTLVETNGPFKASDMMDAPVLAPAEVQRQGTVIRGGWPCGGGRYHVTLLAWLETASGDRSNAMRYTIHCNELLLN